MNDTLRRSQREHAATLAASVRRVLERESGERTDPDEPDPPGRGRLTLFAAAITALAGLVLFALLPWWPGAPATSEAVGVYEIAQGVLGDGARSGAPIPAGTRIETSREGGPTALRLRGGASVRLDRGSRLEVVSESVLYLEEGAVYIDAAAVGNAVEVRTRLGVVRDIGTQFEVRLVEASDAPALRVRVREGAIVLEHDGVSHRADLGEELVIDADGEVVRGVVPTHGAPWAWVLAAAPVPEIEGWTLGAFLDWTARETGLVLRFADEETAARVSEIVLHGDVRETTLWEATAALLESSGFGYRLVGGELIVGPPG